MKTITISLKIGEFEVQAEINEKWVGYDGVLEELLKAFAHEYKTRDYVKIK